MEHSGITLSWPRNNMVGNSCWHLFQINVTDIETDYSRNIINLCKFHNKEMIK